MDSLTALAQSAYAWFAGALSKELQQQIQQTPLSARSIAVYSVSGAGIVTGLVYLAFLKHHRDAHLSAARVQYEEFEAEHDGTIHYIDPPRPGECATFDYTDANSKSIKSSSSKQRYVGQATDISSLISDRKSDEELRVVCWNIERGYKLSSIIAELKQLDADIIVLQECDIDCDRSGNRNVACEIAFALRMRGVYASEAWKVNCNHENLVPHVSEVSEESKDDADNNANGCEGNAILTRFPIKEFSVLNLQCVRNSYMPDHRDQKKHAVCVARIESDQCGDVLCYSAHFDAFAGRVRRAREQYFYLYDHAQKQYTNESKSDPPAIIISGDFNTHNHGIARLWAPYSGDCPVRFGYLNHSEAEWWNEFIIGKEVGHELEVTDPFDAIVDWTVQMFKFGMCVFRGKIDWMIYGTEKLECTQHKVNQVTQASDHQYLLCDFRLSEVV